MMELSWNITKFYWTEDQKVKLKLLQLASPEKSDSLCFLSVGGWRYSRVPYWCILKFQREERDMKMTDDQEKLLEDALGTVKVLFSLVLLSKNAYPGFFFKFWIRTQLLVFIWKGFFLHSACAKYFLTFLNNDFQASGEASSPPDKIFSFPIHYFFSSREILPILDPQSWFSFSWKGWEERTCILLHTC